MIEAGAGEGGPDLGFGEAGGGGWEGEGAAVGGGGGELCPDGGIEGGGGGRGGGAEGSVEVPAGQRAGGDGVDFAEGMGAVVEVDEDAGEVVAVGGPEDGAELGEDADGACGGEEELELVEEVGAPVVEPPAAEGGLGAPLGSVLGCGGADAGGELSEAGLEVEDVSEGS